jgi:hypothetical protein
LGGDPQGIGVDHTRIYTGLDRNKRAPPLVYDNYDSPTAHRKLINFSYKQLLTESLPDRIAVGTPITGRPPHKTERA